MDASQEKAQDHLIRGGESQADVDAGQGTFLLGVLRQRGRPVSR